MIGEATRGRKWPQMRSEMVSKIYYGDLTGQLRTGIGGREGVVINLPFLGRRPKKKFHTR